MKKFALSVLIAAITMPVLTAHADYLDCENRYHYGYPQQGECYYLMDPTDRGGSTNNNNDDVTTGSADDYFGNDNSGYNNDDVTTGSADDYFGNSTLDDNTGSATDSDDKYSDTYIKNYRDYCAGDYCWAIYDECYDDIHCWEKKDRIPRDEYDPEYNPDDNVKDDNNGNDYDYTRNRGNTWNYWYNYVVNNYYMGSPSCDSRYENCVYRGYHFGSYHNGYWWGR